MLQLLMFYKMFLSMIRKDNIIYNGKKNLQTTNINFDFLSRSKTIDLRLFSS